MNKIVLMSLILLTVFIAGCAQTPASKPRYYCDVNNASFCQELFINCTDSIQTTDSVMMITSLDITNRGDSCYVVYMVDKSNIPEYQGASMTCNFPIVDGIVTPTTEEYGYGDCEGPLKDMIFEETLAITTETTATTEQIEAVTERLQKSVNITSAICVSTPDFIKFRLIHTGTVNIDAGELFVTLDGDMIQTAPDINEYVLVAGSSSVEFTYTAPDDKTNRLLVVFAPAGEVWQTLTCS